MAKPATFRCNVITPERSALSCDAEFVAFPAHDGEMGVLRNRAPLICRMGIGQLRVQAVDAQYELFVDGGFAQFRDNQLTLLTEQAKKAADISLGDANQIMVEARAIPVSGERSADERQKAIQRAKVQLKMAQRHTADK